MPFVDPNHADTPLAHYAGTTGVRLSPQTYCNLGTTQLTTLQPALLDDTIGGHFADIVKRYPDRPAVKSGAHRLTYKELDEQSDAVALALRKVGVKAGDRVATTLGISIPHMLVSVAP